MSERDRLLATLHLRCQDQISFALVHTRQIDAALAAALRVLDEEMDIEQAWDTANVLVTNVSKLADAARGLSDYFQE